MISSNLKKQETIEKIFAPNLIKDKGSFRSHENHPWSLLTTNQPKHSKATIIEKIEEWKICNPRSIHQSVANEIIEMLKINPKNNND